MKWNCENSTAAKGNTSAKLLHPLSQAGCFCNTLSFCHSREWGDEHWPKTSHPVHTPNPDLKTREQSSIYLESARKEIHLVNKFSSAINSLQSQKTFQPHFRLLQDKEKSANMLSLIIYSWHLYYANKSSLWVPTADYPNTAPFSLLVIPVLFCLHASLPVSFSLPLSEKACNEPNLKVTSKVVGSLRFSETLAETTVIISNRIQKTQELCNSAVKDLQRQEYGWST